MSGKTRRSFNAWLIIDKRNGNVSQPFRSETSRVSMYLSEDEAKDLVANKTCSAVEVTVTRALKPTPKN